MELEAELTEQHIYILQYISAQTYSHSQGEIQNCSFAAWLHHNECPLVVLPEMDHMFLPALITMVMSAT